MESEEQNDDVGSQIAELGLDVVTQAMTGLSIPKPIKQNVFKAFGRLCSAAVEVPAVYFEGVAAEKRAESAARVKLIETNANQIASQMQVNPEYARAAVRKFGQNIIREQVNLDMISEEAAKQLQQSDTTESSEEVETIDDDWLNRFEKEASTKSTEEMQRLFGKILAGEIRRPASFSIRSVKILGELDKSVASLFKHLCSMCIVLRLPNTSTIFDARVPSLGESPAHNSLQKYGLSFGQLNTLHEYGLIIPDFNSWMSCAFCIANPQRQVSLGFQYQKQEWGLVPESEAIDRTNLKINGVALSKVGQELLPIIDFEQNEDYSTALKAFFLTQKLVMVPVNG